MNYLITYRSILKNETYTVDWFVPRAWGWSIEQARESFEVRHLNADVLTIVPAP